MVFSVYDMLCVDSCRLTEMKHVCLCVEMEVCTCLILCCRPEQKSPIPLNRYEDGSDSGSMATSLQRPTIKKPTRIRGKARAKYTFNAQNNKWVTLHMGSSGGNRAYMLRHTH